MTVVAVLSMKGGVGKTTVSLGLASAAWDRGLRTLVVDLDPQSNASMALDIVDAPFSASDILADARPGVAEEAMVASGWGETVMAIRSERALEHRTMVHDRESAQRLRAALGSLPRRFDLVVIDCPPSLGELTRNALTAADRALVVTEPEHFALHGTTEAVEAVDVVARTTNPRLRTSAILLNRMNPGDREHRVNADRLTAEHGALVFGQPLPDCAGIPQSQRAVSPIHSWNSPGSRAVAEVFDDLLDSLLPPARPEPAVRRPSWRRLLR